MQQGARIQIFLSKKREEFEGKKGGGGLCLFTLTYQPTQT